MLFRNIKIGKAARAAVGSIGVIAYLQKAENVTKIIPEDTKFALVIEAIEKNFDESFSELDASITALSFNWSNEGVVGRFIGLLALSDQKIRIYKSMDLNVTNEQNSSTTLVEDESKTSLIFEADIASMSALNSNILTDSHKKFKILNPYQISGEKNYESKAYGFQGGLSQLYQFMQSRGANVKAASKTQVLIPWVIVVGIMVASFIFLRSHSN